MPESLADYSEPAIKLVALRLASLVAGLYAGQVDQRYYFVPSAAAQAIGHVLFVGLLYADIVQGGGSNVETYQVYGVGDNVELTSFGVSNQGGVVNVQRYDVIQAVVNLLVLGDVQRLVLQAQLRQRVVAVLALLVQTTSALIVDFQPNYC